jgi:hypothetical protein
MQLVKRKTNDGLMEVHDHISLGKIYIIDLDSMRTDILFNTVQKQKHKKVMVTEVISGGSMPLELLEIIGEKNEDTKRDGTENN